MMEHVSHLPQDGKSVCVRGGGGGCSERREDEEALKRRREAEAADITNASLNRYRYRGRR